jgi:hypothetical protein
VVFHVKQTVSRETSRKGAERPGNLATGFRMKERGSGATADTLGVQASLSARRKAPQDTRASLKTARMCGRVRFSCSRVSPRATWLSNRSRAGILRRVEDFGPLGKSRKSDTLEKYVAGITRRSAAGSHWHPLGWANRNMWGTVSRYGQGCTGVAAPGGLKLLKLLDLLQNG